MIFKSLIKLFCTFGRNARLEFLFFKFSSNRRFLLHQRSKPFSKSLEITNVSDYKRQNSLNKHTRKIIGILIKIKMLVKVNKKEGDIQYRKEN